jgi:hypothetical protein
MDEQRQERVLATEARIRAKLNITPEPVQPATPAAQIETPPIEAEAPPATPAPPAQPAPAAPASEPDDLDDEDEDQEDSAPSDGDPAAAPKPKRKQSARLQRRINRIEREKYEAIRERDALAIERAYLLQQFQQNQPAAPNTARAPAVQGEPTLEQFGYDQEAFQKAERQWLIQEAKRAARQEIEQEQAQRQMAEQGTRFTQRVAELEKKMPGAWQRATHAPLQTTPIMERVIFESDVGPEIGVYLADHLDEAHAISRLPPMQQAVALGRIEVAVKAAPALPPRPPVAVSRAPAPPASLPSGASSVAKPADKMTIEDHVAVVRAKQKAKLFG